MDKREIVEAIAHVLRAGCAWRLLPHDVPPWQTVCHDLRRWQREGVWAHIHHTQVMADREREGRRARYPFVEKVCADGGYAGRLVQWAQDKTHAAPEIVKRPPGARGFVAIRRRRAAERTVAWTVQCRRLVRDYEQLTAVAKTLMTIAAIATLVRRAA